MWTRESVLEKLESNPNFEQLFEEFDGRFKCAYYDIGGYVINLFNVGGYPQFYLTGIFRRDLDVEGMREFIRIAYEIIMEKIEESN